MRIKHYTVCCLILLFLFQISCSDIKKKDNEKTIRIEISKDIENNRKRLNLIKETINKYGFLELPYKYYYNSDSMGGISDKIDKELFHSAGIGFSKFIGVLPDTTNNYCILTAMALSVYYLYVSCITKEGEYLFYKENNLFDCNCLHMVEEDIYCNEYIVIKEGLELEYYYKTKYLLSLVEGQNDTICEFKTGKGYINTKDFGKIVFDKIIEKNCLEDE